MVQTDISQLSRECNQWRERLHSYRDEFNQLKSKLQHAVNKSLSKDQLTDLEHYQNQLHIQLINIHDLKQAVKAHDRKVNYEVVTNGGQATDEVYADHENLYEEYQSLEQTLNDLRNDLNRFVSSLQ
jgi:chromosome segregation ATPase